LLKNGSLSFDTRQKELAVTSACRRKHKAVAEKLLKEPYNFPATSEAIDAAFSSRPVLTHSPTHSLT
jgi:hypothetical protein